MPRRGPPDTGGASDNADGQFPGNRFEQEEARLKAERRAAMMKRLAPTQFKPGQSGNPGGLSMAAAMRRDAVNAQDPARVTSLLDMLYGLAIDPAEGAKQRIAASSAYLDVMGLKRGLEDEDAGKVKRLVDDTVRALLAEARASVERDGRAGVIDVEEATDATDNSEGEPPP